MAPGNVLAPASGTRERETGSQVGEGRVMASGTGPEHMNGRVQVKNPGAVTGSVSQELPGSAGEKARAGTPFGNCVMKSYLEITLPVTQLEANRS